jgi:hypothetical protein
MTLSRFDDYCIHQTPEPVAHPASSDRNVYDRYWFNGYADDGDFYFGVALGLYPHLRIMDCGFSIVQAGEQHAFHGSRRAPLDPSESEVGPFRIDVIEPMRRIRVTLAENETGLSCDLLFTARTASVEEGRQTLQRDGRVFMDATRFAQFGRWEGEVRVAGRTIAIDPAHVLGTKDRSWGIRPVGERDPGGAPPADAPQFFFMWSPIHWDDHCTHFGIFEHADGTPWHRDGAIVPAYARPEEIPGVEDPGLERMVSVEHDITYVPGTRRAAAVRLALIARDGRRREIELEPLLRFQMKGIGYTHLEWGHGIWKGELAIAGESFKSDELDPLAIDNLHIQQVMRARSEGREGIGVLEQIAIGPHAPSGFKEFLDGAS